MDKGGPLALADRWLADVQLRGNAGLGAVPPEELIEQPMLRGRELFEKPMECLAIMDDPRLSRVARRDLLDDFRRGAGEAHPVAPLLAVAGERPCDHPVIDEASHGNVARRVEIGLCLPRGRGRHGIELLVPVDGRPIWRCAPGVRATEGGAHGS